MKLYKSLIIVVLTAIICFSITSWYYRDKYKKEAINRAVFNIDFYRLLSTSLDEKEKSQIILDTFYKHQLKLLAKDLNMSIDEENIDPLPILQRIGNYKIIKLKKLQGPILKNEDISDQ